MNKQQEITVPKIIAQVEKIAERINKMENIVINMRSMTNAPDSINITDVDINSLVRDTARHYSARLLSHGIELKLMLSPDLASVRFCVVQLEQVLVNLLNNAANALDTVKKKGKRIIIRSFQNDSAVILRVIDNGPGIAEQNREKIFDPFFTTHNSADGTGMGLYIVHNILKSFDASIEASRSERQETVFSIFLPKPARPE